MAPPAAQYSGLQRLRLVWLIGVHLLLSWVLCLTTERLVFANTALRTLYPASTRGERLPMNWATTLSFGMCGGMTAAFSRPTGATTILAAILLLRPTQPTAPTSSALPFRSLTPANLPVMALCS